MEYLQQRKQAEQVGRILSYTVQKGDDLFISLGSFYTITYLLEIYLKKDFSFSKEERSERLRYILNGVLTMFKLADASSDGMKDGINDFLFDDLEDSYQAHTALDMNCDILLTINERHFRKFNEVSSVEVITPQEFIDTYLK
ncbi:MAG: hypothetical protein IJV33_11205 [Bacteroidaceae bacterium]|nr:hypothetical protein [Bacteroidaceae bacterium]